MNRLISVFKSISVDPRYWFIDFIFITLIAMTLICAFIAYKFDVPFLMWLLTPIGG